MGRKRSRKKGGKKKDRYAYDLTERIGSVSIYKRNKVYYIYYRENGGSKRIAVGRNLNVARRTASELNAELQTERPTLFSFQRIGLPELIERWLGHCLQVKHVSPQTLRRYRAAISHLKDFVKQETTLQFADEVTPEVVDRLACYLRALDRTRNGGKIKPGSNPLRKYSDSGIKFILSTCRTLFAFALDKQHIPAHAGNPCKRVPFESFNGRRTRSLRPFSTDQEASFYEACDDWQFGIFFTLGMVGLRRNELRYMLISDVDWAREVVYIRSKPELHWTTKTKVDREVPLFDEWEQLLRKLIGRRKEGFVFLHQPYFVGREPELEFDSYKEMTKALDICLAEDRKKRSQVDAEDALKADMSVVRCFLSRLGQIPPNRIRQEFMKLTKKIGLPEHTRAHEMRHLFATSMQEAGTDPFVRRDVLGHTSLEMTGRYTKTATATKRREIEKMLQNKQEVAAVVSQRLSPERQTG